MELLARVEPKCVGIVLKDGPPDLLLLGKLNPFISAAFELTRKRFFFLNGAKERCVDGGLSRSAPGNRYVRGVYQEEISTG